jgi:hypothetical protein
MTVSAVYEDMRHRTLPYTITVRYGATDSLIELHRFPTSTMAEQARAMIVEHGLAKSPWPSSFRPS